MLCASQTLWRRATTIPKPLLARAPAVNRRSGWRIHPTRYYSLPRTSPPGISSFHINAPEGPVLERDGSIEGFRRIAWRQERGHLLVEHEGAKQAINIPYIWLRDHCHCSECMNPDTLQRSVDTFSLPRDVHPISAEILDNGIKIRWSHLDHVSFYDWHWLKLKTQIHAEEEDKESKKRHLWGAEVRHNPPTVAYEDVMASDKGVAKWTAKIIQFGFCFVDGCPVSPEATKELLERISIIRETHYGGFYDFTSDLTMKDTAYTSLALPPHTDTTYFTEPVGLQAFHILSHTQGKGGESLLVDGLKCSTILQKKNPDAWNILASETIAWHASGNEGISIQPNMKFPVFETTEFDVEEQADTPDKSEIRESTSGTVYRIRWNNDDRASSKPHSGISDWYNAARLWNDILQGEENQYIEQLVPGRVLVFDNWRVLHGRTAFTGKRRMCGAYLNRDDFMSRWRNTNYEREKILERVI